MNGEEEGDPDEGGGHRVISWGCGEFGQHCHGCKEDVAFSIGLLKEILPGQVKFVACGASHTILVNDSNEIYSWGNGNSGQLGTNVKELQWQPERVHLYDNNPVTLPDVAGVACGGRHSMVWLSNGNVFSFGNNFHAQLGYDYRSKNYKENQEFHLPPIKGVQEKVHFKNRKSSKHCRKIMVMSGMMKNTLLLS